jgi:hypothetical protein
MQIFKRLIIALALATAVFAQAPEPPLKDTRLTIHTLVREDIFAGFLQNDMERFTRGERSLKRLLETRTAAEKPALLAWQGGAALYRAVLAYENKNDKEFQRLNKEAVDLFAQAKQLGPKDGGAAAVTGGSYVVFADRLPKDQQAAAWEKTYEAFSLLWQFQGAGVDKMPLHLSGELLGGMAVSAQRTGRKEEAAKYLDRIETVLADTPYAKVAKQWKANPAAMTNASITCLTCHESGRLAARMASLGGQ